MHKDDIKMRLFKRWWSHILYPLGHVKPYSWDYELWRQICYSGGCRSIGVAARFKINVWWLPLLMRAFFWGHEGCLSRQSAHSNIGHGWIEISKSRITMDQKWSKVGCFQEQQKNIKQQSFIYIYIVLPSGKPTWQWKMNLLKMYSLLKMEIFLYQRVVLVDPVSLAFRILSLFFNTCHVHQEKHGRSLTRTSCWYTF